MSCLVKSDIMRQHNLANSYQNSHHFSPMVFHMTVKAGDEC